jgi:FtsP/CotA-like multicopper oxidase with cupredoxin domain
MLAAIRSWLCPAPVLAAVGITVPGPAAAASVTVDLCAIEGSLVLPGRGPVSIWGFAEFDGTECAPAQLPGPTIDVQVGDNVRVNLHNRLDDTVSIVFPGLELRPDSVGVAPNGTTSYNFIADAPGTYIYESGVDPSIQVPMGLYGALIVRSAIAGQAYNDAASRYDTEALVVLSEIDLDLNANPSSFDLTGYRPKFWLINGKAYPNTDPITVSDGDRLLLRYVNAGLHHHTVALLGLHQSVIARDPYPLPFPYEVVGEILASGQTADSITVVSGGTFALRSRQLRLTNGAHTNPRHSPGGMLTFIEVPEGPLEVNRLR